MIFFAVKSRSSTVGHLIVFAVKFRALYSYGFFAVKSGVASNFVLYGLIIVDRH